MLFIVDSFYVTPVLLDTILIDDVTFKAEFVNLEFNCRLQKLFFQNILFLCNIDMRIRNTNHYGNTTIMCKNYRDNSGKRFCSGSHKQFKTLFKDHMVRLKVISSYIYKDLRPKT